MPAKFKTPGAQAPLVAGDNNKVIVIDAATWGELVRLRREALEAMEPKRIDGGSNASNEARLADSTAALYPRSYAVICSPN